MLLRRFSRSSSALQAPAAGLLAAVALAGPCAAQNAERGAALYLRLENDTRSCASCHGPDPGLSRNNILRAADSPDTLTKVLNTVAPMGFLRAHLTEADRADITAYLGTVVEMNKAESPLQIWPSTLDFGRIAVGATSSEQVVRITNRSASQTLALSAPQVTLPALRVQHDCPAALLPGQTCDLLVRLSPLVPGLSGGTLAIRSPDLARARLAGTVGYGVTTPVSALRWATGSSPVRFGSTSTGLVVEQRLKLENPGPMPAVMETTSITGPQASQFRLHSGCAAGLIVQAGTSCELVIGYTPGRVAAHAALQLGSDQGNPPGIRLEGQPLAEAPVPPDVAQSGGGCSIGPPRGRWDPTLPLLASLAALAWLRSRRRL